MSIIIGSIIVLVGVIGGYLLEHGHLAVLWVPAEGVIIFGAAIGAMVISMPIPHIKETIHEILNALKNPGPNKADFMDLLVFLYQMFQKIRREGLIAIEADIEDPEASDIFKNFGKKVLADHRMLHFVCDNFRVLTTSSMASHELDNMMESEIEALHHGALIPAHAMSRMADGMPALGIVAAVLGVILTMGKIAEPPAVLGHSIGAALVGTFLGVLVSYGFLSPLATFLEHKASNQTILLQVVKVALITFFGGGNVPQTAVEFARRVIPEHEKPTFVEIEAAVKVKK